MPDLDPLVELGHRPWPLPRRPWIMVQVWRELLFAHWKVSASTLSPLIPPPLALDTFEGDAWISITPFHMSLRLRGLPVLPRMSVIPELNCRTYVTTEGKPGIYFFSLDTGRRFAVWGARAFYHLPYFHARMRIDKHDDLVSYSSHRAGADAAWKARYRPIAQVQYAKRDTTEHWLVERYCLYTLWRGRLYRGDVHHGPWPLQQAWVDIKENSIAEAIGVHLHSAPTLAEFAHELKVLIWPLQRVI